MFTLFNHKKAPHHAGCMIVHIVLAVLVALAVIASFVGMILAHWSAAEGAIIFGTPAASLSLLAFVASVVVFMKQLKACVMPCEVCAMMPAPSKKK
jgi:drug/metabolite transporter (DMT)-like permease